MVARQNVYIQGDYTPPPTQTPVLPDDTDPLASSTPTTPVEPTPYVKKIPNHIWFTQRSIDCEIQGVGIIDSGELAGKMDTIDSAKIAAWYEDGPSPGEYGNSLINGHVRWKGEAGAFSVLHDMEIGEEVVIGFTDGSIEYFRVTDWEIYPQDDYPSDIMGPKGDARVTLITCHGDFDHSAGTSENRCFVTLKLASEVAAE